MSSTQLSFNLSTSSKVKTVHLLGSWDNYAGQLPLSKDSSSKPGKWRGTFRFGVTTLKPGKRYWYYYIIDGYHVSHDPSTSSTKEPTTGRLLNILDVPKSAPGGSKSSNRQSVEVAKGRSISPSKIICPKPSKPYASRAVREADYSVSPVDDLASQLEKTSMYTHIRDISPPSSIGSSLSSSSRGSSNRSSGFDRNSPSSLSSLSDPATSSSGGSRCSCNRWGVTRRGERVKLDCGGGRCGYSDDSSSCSSIEESTSGSDSASNSSDSEEDVRPMQRKKGGVSSGGKGGYGGKASTKYVEIKPKSKVVISGGGRRR